jgi:4-amino-4-deoxy-L-arabinose transferase-like glycosyltransferase
MSGNKILFALLIVITIFFRLYHLGDIPLGINNDAAWEGSAVREIIKGNWKDYVPYAAGWHGEPIIRITIAALTPFIGNTTTTIKLASSIFGILLIPLLYIFLKKLFPLPLAFLTSFFVATSGWHIIMSRSGWRAITVPTIVTPVFLCLYQAIQTKQRIWYIISGAALALTLYTYDAARIVTLVVIGIVLYRRRGALPFFLSFTLITAPILFYAVINWNAFVSRTTYLLHTRPASLLQNVKIAAGLFTYRANGNDFFINEPLLDPPINWLFPIGFCISLWMAIKKKDKRHVFMLGWFFISLIPAILSEPNGNRAIGALPAVYFFAANALVVLASTLRSFRVILMAYVVLFSIAATYISYFGPNRKEPKGFYPETFVTANYLKTKLQTHAIFITDNFPREILTYLLFKQNYTWYPQKEYMLTAPKNANKKNLFVLMATDDNRRFAEKLGGIQRTLPHDAAIIIETP